MVDVVRLCPRVHRDLACAVRIQLPCAARDDGRLLPRLLHIDARIEQVGKRIHGIHSECSNLLGDRWVKAQAELTKGLRETDLPIAQLSMQVEHRVRSVVRHAS